MQISGSLNKKLIHKSVCWQTRDNNLHAAQEKWTGRKEMEFLGRKKNVEKTSCFTVFYTKFFPIVRIKKMEKLKTMASV